MLVEKALLFVPASRVWSHNGEHYGVGIVSRQTCHGPRLARLAMWGRDGAKFLRRRDRPVAQAQTTSDSGLRSLIHSLKFLKGPSINLLLQEVFAGPRRIGCERTQDNGVFQVHWHWHVV